MIDTIALLPAIEAVARRAGSVILEVYASDFSVENKGDSSPVTEADRRAEAVILPELARLLPGVPAIAEEEVAAGRIPAVGDTFWLVDPLDGTKEFIKRNGEFTVNIGLISGGIPILGVVYAPVLDILWSGTGNQAWREDPQGRRPITCRTPPAEGAIVLTSRSHRNPEQLDSWMAQLRNPVTDFSGSSLKFCRVAEGSADFYPRFGPTCEWDTGAAHAVVLAAGGEVVTFDGAPLQYGKVPRFLNPDFLTQAKATPRA